MANLIDRLYYHLRICVRPNSDLKKPNILRWGVSLFINSFHGLFLIGVGFGLFPIAPEKIWHFYLKYFCLLQGHESLIKLVPSRSKVSRLFGLCKKHKLFIKWRYFCFTCPCQFSLYVIVPLLLCVVPGYKDL